MKVSSIKQQSYSSFGAKEIALCGLMGGLSSALMLFRFPIPFMPPFLSFDFSGLVEMIGGFAMGPFAAFAIIVVKILLQLLTQGTRSAYTGELQNLMLSCAYVLPAVIIYSKHKTRKMALVGMTVGTVLCAAVAVFTNLFIIIPFYATMFGMTMDDIVSMCKAVNPFLSNKWSMALLGIVPFNLIKNGVLSFLTYLTYKKFSPQIKNFIGQ